VTEVLDLDAPAVESLLEFVGPRRQCLDRVGAQNTPQPNLDVPGQLRIDGRTVGNYPGCVPFRAVLLASIDATAATSCFAFVVSS